MRDSRGYAVMPTVRAMKEQAAADAARRSDARFAEVGQCTAENRGRFCKEPGRASVGGAWFCTEHHDAATREVASEREEYLVSRIRRLGYLLDNAYDTIGRLREPDHVVYYAMRMSDGHIKIGTTKHFATRMRRLGREHGELMILAVQPGGEDLETGTHGRFRRLHVEGEWFRSGAALLRWILELRQDPAVTQPAMAVRELDIRIMLAKRQAGGAALERHLGIRAA